MKLHRANIVNITSIFTFHKIPATTSESWNDRNTAVVNKKQTPVLLVSQ